MVKNKIQIHSINKKLSYEFNIIKKWQGGMKLDGYDVKLLRKGISLQGTYAIFKNNRLFLKNLTDETIPLLLHKKEFVQIQTIQQKNRGSSLQIADLHSIRGFFKVTIALCVYKKERDRREDIKKRQLSRKILKFY